MVEMNQNDYVTHTGWHQPDFRPIPVLEAIKEKGRVWEDLAVQYGVTNPEPPWQIDLEATCDMLAGDSCVKPYEEVVPGSCTLPSLERRAEEDELAATLYEDVPFPERQLLALAHSLIARGLLDEEDLARRIEAVSERLHSA
ncbi:hypothetical protein [Thiocapsa roseopersicina]|jgi:hypothetical protein|uniref:Uncharacterized protein n=1 Tax=Thiocapsa roseopersicina TaxID=1058 RepID=A0A1H3DFX9_THIRO|nr:hypothetical protein [Thiocapsa roseopersicina]SDX64599.1 hypothetical protein SAMN05421783_1479 [Thiocapsa roseopersicina]